MSEHEATDAPAPAEAAPAADASAADAPAPGLPKWVKVTIGVIALGLLVTGAAVANYKLSPYHFREVEPGVLYRSGILRPGNFRKVIKEHGIKTVVVLPSKIARDPKPDWYLRQIKDCAELGVTQVDMPMESETPPSEDQIEEWIGLLEDPAAQPILVHCANGVVRTGELVAIFEREFKGKPNQQVFDELPKFGHSFDKPRRAKVKEFILTYKTRAERAAEAGGTKLPEKKPAD